MATTQKDWCMFTSEGQFTLSICIAWASFSHFLSQHSFDSWIPLNKPHLEPPSFEHFSSSPAALLLLLLSGWNNGADDGEAAPRLLPSLGRTQWQPENGRQERLPNPWEEPDVWEDPVISFSFFSQHLAWSHRETWSLQAFALTPPSFLDRTSHWLRPSPISTRPALGSLCCHYLRACASTPGNRRWVLDSTFDDVLLRLTESLYSHKSLVPIAFFSPFNYVCFLFAPNILMDLCVWSTYNLKLIEKHTYHYLSLYYYYYSLYIYTYLSMHVRQKWNNS